MSLAKAKRAARAVADVSDGTILAKVEIAAAAERVYRALTSPDEIANGPRSTGMSAPFVSVPPWFSRIVIVFRVAFACAMSGQPFRSKRRPIICRCSRTSM